LNFYNEIEVIKKRECGEYKSALICVITKRNMVRRKIARNRQK